MQREAYPAARTVAPKVQAYFARRWIEAHRAGRAPLAAPDAQTIESVIDAAFWASLRREEGYVPRISLAILSPDEAPNPLLFARPLPLDPGALTRVAPAVERPGIHLGVSRFESELCVWGTTNAIPVLCLVLEVAAPGLLVIKHHSGDESGKFVNIAVLEGDQIKLVDQQASTIPDCPEILKSLLAFDWPSSWDHEVNLPLELAVSMRAHGRGGSLLMVPAGSDSWQQSILQPMHYGVVPPFCELANLYGETPHESAGHIWQEALDRSIAAIAGLTAVDGAIVLTDRFELLGFGAKIARRKGWQQVEQVMLTEPIEGAVAQLVHPEQLGGTRHLSAAQFVHDQRDAVAMVASQDGRFTIFSWSPCESLVHAHRVEVLLL
jgi:sensor domain DACNV-containing protein